MKKVLYGLSILMMVLFHQFSVQAQTTGSIGGTVVDANGAILPNASVSIKGQSGQTFSATTTNNGTYQVPAVAAGFYTVTITSSGFKTFVVNNVKVDVGTPTTINAALEIGQVGEIVEVTSGGEVLQTQTATVGTTITGRQITETPITSRDALDLVTLLPGTNTTGAARRSTVNGLPKGTLAITIDGVDVQDNYLRSSDGFFTYVRPRVDAIDEVTVSTAAPGAESSGDGAVQIKFVTRRGTNDYTGGVFWQHRNNAANSNYWFNNRDNVARQRVLLNQFGGRLGGPLPFPNFGEGGPMFNKGKDKAFFFVNYEEFRYPESQTRTRTVLQQQAQNGIYTYIGSKAAAAAVPTGCTGITDTQIRCQRNVYDIAGANGFTNTPDPTILGVLNDIRNATSGMSVIPITNDFNRQNVSFSNPGMQKRTFLALRFDVNITKKHSVENVTNHQKFDSNPDFLNSMDPAFPGMINQGSQGSTRNSNSTALRSNFTNNIVNEARYSKAWGESQFAPGVSRDQFPGGFALAISSAFSITNPHVRNNKSGRTSPTDDFTNTLTWIKGNHSFSFGGQFKRIGFEDYATNAIVPTVYFGLSSVNNIPAFDMFSTAVMPGATAGQLNEARALYAMLTGTIIQADFIAYLSPDGTYKVNDQSGNKVRQDTYGLFAQDSWRIRQNLTVNYGLRWQPQTSYVALSDNYGRLANVDMIWGVSGRGNEFKPGTLSGTAPTIVKVNSGEAASPTVWNNFAPSVGVVWSPNLGDGFLGKVFGSNGRSVLRGGYSTAFVREGTLLLLNLLGSNPGAANIDLRRHTALPQNGIVPGTLLRTPNNPNLTPLPFNATPSFPYTVLQNQGINAFDQDLKTGKVDSWSFGYQRELDKNTVVEVRYVGNRGKDLWVQHNLNELNVIENGFASEFKIAQANLYANIAAGRANQGFRYTGEPGTNPLPIMLSYTNVNTTNSALGNYTNPNSTASYTNAFFTNTTYLSYLTTHNPNVLSLAAGLENAVTNSRANALANGRPANFFYVNPTSASGGAYLLRNAEKSWYDAAVIEVRRRMSAGLRLEASYTFSKAFTNAYSTSAGNDQVNFAGISLRNPDLQKTLAQHNIPWAFKFNATYDMPFGTGRQFFSGSNKFVNGFVGGWSIAPVFRWQSGSPIVFQNVQLVGMTRDELQREIKVRKGPNVVTFLPDDIIVNTQRAFNIDVLSANGYGTTYGGAPSGRYIAPAGTGNCQATYSGECGFANLALRGPIFARFDVAVMKRINFSEKRNIELKANFFNATNSTQFRIGGWGADTVIVGAGGATFGQLGPGTAYQDVSTTNDPGGRIIEFMFRFNF